MLSDKPLDKLSKEDVAEFTKNRKNTAESNHPYGERPFMKLLLAGSKKILSRTTENVPPAIPNEGKNERR